MKILIISYDYYPNNIWGVGLNVKNFVDFVKKTDNVTLVTAKFRKENIDIISVKNDIQEYFLFGKYLSNNAYKDSDLMGAFNVLLAKKIKKFYNKIKDKPDIIYNHGWMTWECTKIVADYFKVPVVSSIHFFEKQYLFSNNNCTKTDWKDIFKLEKEMFTKSKKLIVYTENEKNNIKNLYNIKHNNFAIIPQNIDLPTLDRQSSMDKIKILFVGRLIKDKGIEELIEIFDEISLNYKNVELVIVGDGVLKENLELNNHNKKVTFVGWKEGVELYNYYNTCDIFCFPSKTETFGMVLIEAMKYKIPIITTEGDSVANIVENNYSGLTSRLTCENNMLKINKEDFKEKIIKLIEDKKLRSYLANNAFEVYKRKYIFNENQEIRKLLMEVLKNERI